MNWRISDMIVPALAALVGLILIGNWVLSSDSGPLSLRRPGMDRPEGSAVDTQAERQPPVAGQPVKGPGAGSTIAGAWPWFRGPQGDGISREDIHLSRNWPESGPPVAWTAAMGEGYAGAAIADGRVYVLDYDEQAQADTLRCLSLADGQEIWRNGYPVELMRNHGMSRTTPAVSGQHIVTIGPRCHVACWDAATGECQWLIDLELEYGTEVPRWYTGQCPLIDDNRLIVAPGGRVLLMAIDIETGKPIWQTPNPQRWKMTHVSIVPMQWADQRTYVYCTNAGIVGVSASDGTVLWQSTEWVEQFAIAPSPVILPDGRIFLSSGYDSKVGSMMLQLQAGSDPFRVQTLFKLTPRQFNSEQQTPLFFKEHLFGIRKQGGGKLVCLDLDGNEVWNSGKDRFGHGPYMIADDAILALSNNGRLVMAEADPKSYRPVASYQVFEGGIDAWGPMALAGGRLIVRDITRMTCLDLTAPSP